MTLGLLLTLLIALAMSTLWLRTFQQVSSALSLDTQELATYSRSHPPSRRWLPHLRAQLPFTLDLELSEVLLSPRSTSTPREIDATLAQVEYALRPRESTRAATLRAVIFAALLGVALLVLQAPGGLPPWQDVLDIVSVCSAGCALILTFSHAVQQWLQKDRASIDRWVTLALMSPALGGEVRRPDTPLLHAPQATPEASPPREGAVLKEP